MPMKVLHVLLDSCILLVVYILLEQHPPVKIEQISTHEAVTSIGMIWRSGSIIK